MSRTALALSLLALAGCGTRTGLIIPDCPDGGALECETTCGSGVRLCIDGDWGECESPPVERPCEDACGAGIELCVDGAWRACIVAPVDRPCMTACGAGVETCEGADWGRCSTQPLPPLLAVTVRDFPQSHPDFEAEIGNDRGIVQTRLGPEDKPVYAGPTPTTHGREAFDQWFRDVPGVNMSTPIDLVLRARDEDPRIFNYEDDEFFPIDGRLFGNEGHGHNYHFTLEAVTEFVYMGGELFRFSGDDDVFVFINRRLAIDLGGVRGTANAAVDLDASARDLGLLRGERYPIHFFFAERHTRHSTFSLTTSVVDPLRCP